MSTSNITPAPRDALTIARILKVNHAGEYGAIRIYGAQIQVARWLYPDLVDSLTDMRRHEIEHCAKFRAAMPPRRARPCRVMSLWSLGGWGLGFLTALMGRQMVWTCTAAVESAVHRHLDEQLAFLAGRDADLHALISSIRVEELSHLDTAEANLSAATAYRRACRAIIGSATDLLIWLSTWGDSVRMTRDIRSAAS